MRVILCYGGVYEPLKLNCEFAIQVWNAIASGLGISIDLTIRDGMWGGLRQE